MWRAPHWRHMMSLSKCLTILPFTGNRIVISLVFNLFAENKNLCLINPFRSRVTENHFYYIEVQ